MKCLLFCLAAMIAQAQTYLPHIADPTKTFETTVSLTNTASTTGAITIKGYNVHGIALATESFQVPGDGIVNFFPADTYGNSISHLEVVSASEGVLMSATYKNETAGSAPASAGEKTPASTWHLLPGDWSLTWDGLAVVNTGTTTARVRIYQRSASGAQQALYTVGDLAPNQKALVVLSNKFSQRDGSLIEITSDEKNPLVVTALRGNNSLTILWENAAQAYVANTTEMPLDQALGLWVFAFNISTSTFTHSYALADTGVLEGSPISYGYDELGDLVLATYDEETGLYFLYDQGTSLDRWYAYSINNGEATGCYYQGSNGVITSSCYTTAGSRLVVNTKNQHKMEELLPAGDPPAHMVRMAAQLRAAWDTFQ